jgi:hypothetical protein
MLSGIAVAEPEGEVETIVIVVLSARPGVQDYFRYNTGERIAGRLGT